MKPWNDLLTERDKQVFAQSGFGKPMGFGRRPAILVVDINYNFIGDKPEPILDSIRKWRHSCGEEGWVAVAHTARLLEAAREKRVPVIYSTGQEPRADGFCSGRWRDKNARDGESYANDMDNGNAIPEQITPHPQDIVIPKLKPSAFFGTMLTGHLIDLGVDSLLICGTTTSGCVRASVIDAFSYNYKVAVVEQCCFDRGQSSHAISLFDMNEKYADVVDVDQSIDYIRTLPDDLFEDSLLFKNLTTEA